MHSNLTGWQHDLLTSLKPDEPLGALCYFAIFVVIALVMSRLLRATLHAALSKQPHADRTTINFLQQIGSALIWVIVLILYAHLIPVLRAMGTALLAGAGVASVVLGLAAQSTLGNLVAGISLTIYRPFHLGDTLQVAAPTGTEIGTVENISLGYTTLRVQDGRLVTMPNSVAASQVAINLSAPTARWPLSIAIRLNRDADLGAARTLAHKAAAEVVGEAAVAGCFLTSVDATDAQLELRFQVPDAGSRDSQRTAVMLRLDERFSAKGQPGTPAQRPTFA